MDLTVDWLAEPHIIPRIEIRELAGFTEVEVEPCLRAAYRYLDATGNAQQRGGQPPALEQLLSGPQSIEVAALPSRWEALEAALAAALPAAMHPALAWTVLTITNRVHEGAAVVGVKGLTEVSGVETSTAAWIAGSRVCWAGEADAAPAPPGEPHDPIAPRSSARAAGMTAQRALDLARAGDWNTLHEHLAHRGEAVRPLMEQLVLWVARESSHHGVALIAEVAALSRATGDQHDHFHPRLLAIDRAEVLQALHDAGLVQLRPALLHQVSKPFELERLAALGLDLEHPHGGDPNHTPLVTHRNRPACFARLLALGADPAVLEDGAGGVRFTLGPTQRAALRRRRPDLHIPEPEASLRPDPEPDR